MLMAFATDRLAGGARDPSRSLSTTGALARTRTPNLAGRSRLLFRLSYESDLDMQAGIEPARCEVAAHRVPISPLHELERAERLELPFSPPFTDHRFVAGVGYARVLAALPGIEPRSADSEPAALPLS